MMICSRYVLFLWTLVTLSSCSYLNEQAGIEDDALIEECIEMLIESQMGLPNGMIDLTPATPENLT